MISTTYTAPAQTCAELALPDQLNLPPAFDAKRYPILARHWPDPPGHAPRPSIDRAPRALRMPLRFGRHRRVRAWQEGAP